MPDLFANLKRGAPRTPLTCHYSGMPTGAEICVDLFKSVEMPLGSGLSEDQLGQIEADFSFTFDKDANC